MTESNRLARQVATAIRHERERQELTQQALADLAGLGQGTLAHIERGDRLPSLPMVERLFAALGRQLRVGVEPLDSHLDAALDALAERSVGERIDELGLDARSYPVEPLVRVEVADPRTADLLRRHRQRLGSAG
ncbi:helix-turn-helix transcriptional regulator [Micromonospora sp. SL1-18]|uniref:helix-turn-helix transcriptional regulator n=1 Tax=Micromonospora sp. SL1-18 TaxID=3399128 RepID=UPI003A4D762C